MESLKSKSFRVATSTTHDCVFCNFKAPSHVELQRHREKFHVGCMEAKCPECDFSTAFAGVLKRHIAISHRLSHTFPCPYCKYASSRSGTLQMHIRRKHPEVIQNENSQVKATKFSSFQRLEELDFKFNLPTAPSIFDFSMLSSTDAPQFFPRFLIVGEMDFSFSMSLSRQSFNESKPLRNGLVLTTSFIEKEDFSSTRLCKIIRKNIRILGKRGVIVQHGVDATNLLQTIDWNACEHEVKKIIQNAEVKKDENHRPTDDIDLVVTGTSERKLEMSSQVPHKFDRIIFCFPRATTITGSHPDNLVLLRRFFESAKTLLATNGCIALLLHVCVLNGVRDDQYDTWGVDEIVSSSGLIRTNILPCSFDNSSLDFPGYQPRARDGRAFHPDEAFFHILQVCMNDNVLI
eukprot:g5176.t1